MSDLRRMTQDLGSAPLGDLIAAVGAGVAQAQAALDAGSIEQTLALYDQSDEAAQRLRDMGYRPTFYSIPETQGELKISLTVAGQNQPKAVAPAAKSGLQRIRPQLYAAPVDARYQNSYSFGSEVSATVSFKVVAVPPPSEVDEARVVPNLVAMTLTSARDLADRFDLGVVVDGDDQPAEDSVVATQSPDSGEVVVAGRAITLTVSPPV